MMARDRSWIDAASCVRDLLGDAQTALLPRELLGAHLSTQRHKAKAAQSSDNPLLLSRDRADTQLTF